MEVKKENELNVEPFKHVKVLRKKKLAVRPESSVYAHEGCGDGPPPCGWGKIKCCIGAGED